jgi:hypothetical protein
MLWKKSSSAACWCSHSQNCIRRGWSSGNMCAPRVVVWMQLIVMKYFENPPLGQSQFSCDIARASPRPSFHSCNYGIFIGWCPYNPWTICIYKCRRCYTSCLTETLLQLSKHVSVWMTSTRIT